MLPHHVFVDGYAEAGAVWHFDPAVIDDRGLITPSSTKDDHQDTSSEWFSSARKFCVAAAQCTFAMQLILARPKLRFRLYWTWKSRHLEGRPSAFDEVRNLIRQMSLANPRWGALRVHGELLKLGIPVSQATVAKYMVRQRKPPSQTWRAFLNNHTKDFVSPDFLVVTTVAFQLLFVFVILDHDRRRPIHFSLTSNPIAEWTARQLLYRDSKGRWTASSLHAQS